MLINSFFNMIASQTIQSMSNNKKNAHTNTTKIIKSKTKRNQKSKSKNNRKKPPNLGLL